METVFTNARVVTLDPKLPAASSLRVRDGRIVEVGDALAGPTQVDLGGAVVVPGIIDAHIHLQWLGASLRKVEPWIKADLDFHETLADACGNRLLRLQMAGLRPVLQEILELFNARERSLGLAFAAAGMPRDSKDALTIAETKG